MSLNLNKTNLFKKRNLHKIKKPLSFFLQKKLN